jgi:hypothetical protein
MIGSGSSGWILEPLVRDRLEQLEREADAERLVRLVRACGGQGGGSSGAGDPRPPAGVPPRASGHWRPRDGRTPMNVATVLAIWLPSLALVIAWDYEGTLGRVVVPALQRSLASVLHRLVGRGGGHGGRRTERPPHDGRAGDPMMGPPAQDVRCVPAGR